MGGKKIEEKKAVECDAMKVGRVFSFTRLAALLRCEMVRCLKAEKSLVAM